MKLQDYIQFKQYNVKYAGSIDMNHEPSNTTYTSPVNTQQPDYSGVKATPGNMDASNINWGDTQYTYKPTPKQINEGRKIWLNTESADNPRQQIQDKWDEMRNTAARADVMRWYMGGGRADNDLGYPSISAANDTDSSISMYSPGGTSHVPNGDTITLANNSAITTAGHEYGHEFRHRAMGPNYYYLSHLGQENDASFRSLPEGMQQILGDDPELFDRFKRYSEQRLEPAYDTHVAATKYRRSYTNEAKREADEAYAKFHAMDTDPMWAKMDDNIYEQLKAHAIKHGYNPNMGWWNNPKYATPPKQDFTADPIPSRWYIDRELYDDQHRLGVIHTLKDDPAFQPKPKPFYKSLYDMIFN